MTLKNACSEMQGRRLISVTLLICYIWRCVFACSCLVADLLNFEVCLHVSGWLLVFYTCSCVFACGCLNVDLLNSKVCFCIMLFGC